MAEIITDEYEMLEYVKLNMGMPVINIELADEQFLMAINDAVLEFQKYAASEATYMEHCILNLSAGTSYYPVSACRSVLNNGAPVNPQSVNDCVISSNLDGINNLFTPAHILLMETGALMYPNGTAFGPIINTQGAGHPLSNYTNAIMYLKEITNIFGKSITMRFIQGKGMLQANPTPTISGPCIVLLTQGLTASELYGFTNFRKLAIAKCLIIYARVLRKYSGSLPDGLTLNASEVMAEGKELYDQTLKDIKAESQPIDFFVM